jgi:hypothetical protein
MSCATNNPRHPSIDSTTRKGLWRAGLLPSGGVFLGVMFLGRGEVLREFHVRRLLLFCHSLNNVFLTIQNKLLNGKRTLLKAFAFGTLVLFECCNERVGKSNIGDLFLVHLFLDFL